MSALRAAAAFIGVAVTLARHPVVRAGLRAAPLLITPGMKEAVEKSARAAAFKAGVLAGRLVKRR